MPKHVLISVPVPLSHANKPREVIGKAGGGRLGNYAYGSITTSVVGRGIALQNANPTSGKRGQLDKSREEKIDVVCFEEDTEKIVQAIKSAHPYEEPVILVFPVMIYQ